MKIYKNNRKKFIVIIMLFILILNSIIPNNSVRAIEENSGIIKQRGIFYRQNIEGTMCRIQDFDVEFKDNANSYNISISGFPEGTKILNESNIEINVLESESFKIVIPENNIGVELTGNINVNGENYVFSKETNKSTVRVTVVLEDGGFVQNTVIEIKKGEEIISTGTTNTNGEVIFNNLQPGFYNIVQKDNNGNIIPIDLITFDLRYDSRQEIRIINKKEKNFNLTVENEKKKGTIEIHVVDAENNQIPIGNVEIEISAYAGSVKEVLTTDENGIANSSRLPTEIAYSVKQKTTLENYNIDFSVKTVRFSEDGEKIIVEFKNMLKKNFIKITKVDKDNNDIKLQGVVFGIYSAEDVLIEEITTDANGEAISSNLPINKEYKIKEIKALDNYVLDEKTVTIYLTENAMEQETKEIGRVGSKINFLLIENQKLYDLLPKFGC